MIRIGKPYIQNDSEISYLKAPIYISEDAVKTFQEMAGSHKACEWLTDIDYMLNTKSGEPKELWFSVPSQYAASLCTVRSDAFVVAMLWYAMVTGSNIEFSVPISKKLFDGITEKLIPEISKTDPICTHLIGPVNDAPVMCKGGTASGMSLGTDSFYTLNKHRNELTHLTYYNAGSLYPIGCDHLDYRNIIETENKVHQRLMDEAAIVAAESGLEFLPIITNLDEEFYRGGCIYTAMYRYMACTLSVQHLLSDYISSSSGEKSAYACSLFVPSQRYEDLLCESLQTENLTYRSSDDDKRIEKLRVIGDDPLFQKYANVCFNNCSCMNCHGCWKTIFALDFLGKFIYFGHRFDLEDYYKTRKEKMKELIAYAKRPEAASARETVKQLTELANQCDCEAARDFLQLLDQ